MEKVALENILEYFVFYKIFIIKIFEKLKLRHIDLNKIKMNTKFK